MLAHVRLFRPRKYRASTCRLTAEMETGLAEAYRKLIAIHLIVFGLLVTLSGYLSSVLDDPAETMMGMGIWHTCLGLLQEC